MKILLITMEYPPDRGGVGNYYFNLVKNLQNHRVEVFKADVSSFYRLLWPRWLKLYFRLKRKLKQEKFDLIWAGQVLPIGIVAYLLKKSLNLPYFVSAHGMDIMLPQKNLRKEKLMMKALNEAKFITANSRFTKSQLVKLGLADEKIEVVYPGCHISGRAGKEAVGKLRRELNLTGKQVLLTVGRLVERKGQSSVIAALPRLLDDFPNLVYLIVGSGPCLGRLKLKAENLNLSDRVIFITGASDEDLPAYYCLADVFVMPARDISGDVEGFGIVYLEALSYGLPVVAGRSGGAPEAIVDQESGLLANPDNVSDLSQKIFELLKDKGKADELVRKGRGMIASEFNWPDQAAKLSQRL